MQRTSQNKKLKQYSIGMAIGLIGLIACFVLCIGIAYGNAVRFQQNVIGALYLENTVNARSYLYALFGEITQEQVEASKEALEVYGFTDSGIVYIGSAMGLLQSGIFGGILTLVFLIGVLFFWYKKECMQKAQIMDLKQEILKLQQNAGKEEYLSRQNTRIQTFIENVAHQIKTPISRVFSNLELLEEEIEEEQMRLRLRECNIHLESINVLMKRLMDIGRLEAGKVLFQKEWIVLDELLKDSIQSCCGEAGRVMLRYELEEKGYYGDYEWLKEAFSNIIKNALEADDSGRPIEIQCSRNMDFVKIVIRDHGAGICEKDIPNIFNRFYLPEDAKSSHIGIGLNLAKLIIEEHFGSVYVYNHAEGGAVFKVLLPVYESLKVGRKG